MIYELLPQVESNDIRELQDSIVERHRYNCRNRKRKKLNDEIITKIKEYIEENEQKKKIDISERTSIKSRQKEGIASAKKRGVKFGRPKRVVSDKQKNIISLYLQKWESREITTKFFMEKMELKPNSFYR